MKEKNLSLIPYHWQKFHPARKCSALKKLLKVTPAKGPLRVHPTNPRYFTDGSRKAVLLTGSHNWANLQDLSYETLPSPPAMNFASYLAFPVAVRLDPMAGWQSLRNRLLLDTKGSMRKQ